MNYNFIKQKKEISKLNKVKNILVFLKIIKIK